MGIYDVCAYCGVVISIPTSHTHSAAARAIRQRRNAFGAHMRLMNEHELRHEHVPGGRPRACALAQKRERVYCNAPSHIDKTTSQPVAQEWNLRRRGPHRLSQELFTRRVDVACRRSSLARGSRDTPWHHPAWPPSASHQHEASHERAVERPPLPIMHSELSCPRALDDNEAPCHAAVCHPHCPMIVCHPHCPVIVCHLLSKPCLSRPPPQHAMPIASSSST